ncbi:MAG: hypothetical protein IJW82_08290 [Clostridia bacterium]|nr:hypothetical protein [Clostridia bacterium]
MRCPFCYEKIKQYSNVCSVCGFNTEELKSASNTLVPEMRKKDPESVIMVTDIPDDVNHKKLFLLCLFFGMIGIHSIYVKRYFRGFYSLAATIILWFGTAIIYGWIYIPALYSEPSFTGIIGIIGATAFVGWIFDFVNIIFGKFKIPVVLKDKI